MLRVTRKQLEQLLIVCGHLDTKPTKHNIFVVASMEDEGNYRRFLCGDLTKRQRSKLYWANVKRARAQETRASR